ncbi:MAG: hypothetical protein JWR32_4297 [Mycobacterium sp.]|jgi:hypothetical protein|nr:hypothetical protein [Mycobacterium sp.]
MFEDVEDAAVVDAISTSARAENAACARRLAAVAELYKRRQIPVEDGNGRELWRIDPWEAVAAEVAAAQCITPAAASAQLHWATCLDERLPKVAAVFATGEISLRTAKIIIARTLLAIDPDVLAGIDAEIADTITGWGPMSVDKTERAVDVIVTRRDPAARRRTADRVRSRHFTIDTTPNGQTTSIWGELYSTDATLLDRRLTAMAHQVCEADPRTVEQRRADALGALAAGQTRLTCACGGSTCGATPSVAPSGVVVHVVAEAASLDAATDRLSPHGESSTRQLMIRTPEEFTAAVSSLPPPPDPLPDPPPRPAVVIGGPVIPTELLTDLIARGAATVRTVTHPGDAPPEPRYRPSEALVAFVRCRDLTCRFPGCRRPADLCDLDHTVPYDAGGATHPSNLKCLCRKHHLVKTFWDSRDHQSDSRFN